MRKLLDRYFPVSLLFVFLAMVLWTCGGGGGGGGGTQPAFSQSDLGGTWDLLELDTGNFFGWARANVSVDGSGNVTLNNFTDSSGFNYPGPPLDVFTKWVIDGSGTIRQYDTDTTPNVLRPSLYGSLASNKGLAVVTDNDSSFTYTLIVARKRDASVVFGNSDIRGKAFVYHQLYAGTDNVWEYGYGSIDASGNVTIDNVIGPSGPSPGYPQIVDTIAVYSAGIVTNADNTFYGVLTADKSTLFGLITEPLNPNPRDRLIVIQFLGQTYAQTDLAGKWRFHVLYGWNSPGWLKGSWTINSAGAATYDDFLTDMGFTVPPATPEVLTLASDGIISNTVSPTYHGMMSAGKDLYVRTRSHGTAPVRYSIGISVK